MIAKATVKRMMTFQLKPPSGGLCGDFCDRGDSGGSVGFFSDIMKAGSDEAGFPARDANPRKWNENAFFLSNCGNALRDCFHQEKGGQCP